MTPTVSYRPTPPLTHKMLKEFCQARGMKVNRFIDIAVIEKCKLELKRQKRDGDSYIHKKILRSAQTKVNLIVALQKKKLL